MQEKSGANFGPGGQRALLVSLFAPEPGETAPEPAREPGDGAAEIAVALARAAQRARAQGFAVLELGVQAPAPLRELIDLHAAIALQGVRHGRPSAPTAIISAASALHAGAAVDAAQWLLALAMAIDAHPAIHACAQCVPRDPVAGAAAAYFLAPDTLARARQHGALDARTDAAAVFERLGDRMAGTTAAVFLSAILLVP